MRTYALKSAPEQTIRAEKLTANNAAYLTDMCGGMKVLEHDALDSSKTMVGINVPTLSGNKRLSEGDYLVLVNGRFSVEYAPLIEDMYQETNE